VNESQLYDFLVRQRNPEISRRYFFKWLVKKGVGGMTALTLANLAFNSCTVGRFEEEGLIRTGGGSKDALLVGVVGAFSGLGAFVGRLTERGLNAAVAEINKNGGIGGRKVDWLKGDGGTDVAQARQKFTEFAQDPRVIGIMFATPLGVNESLRDIKKGNIPTILTFTDLYSTNRLYPQDPNAPRSVFQYFLPGKWILEGLARYAKQDRGYTKIGVMYVSLLGADFENLAREAASKFGLQIVASETYPLNATDVGPQLQRLKASGCEALAVYGLPSDTANVVKGLAALGAKYKDTPTAKSGTQWAPQLMGDPAGMGERQWAVLAGDAAATGSVSVWHIGGLLYLPQFKLPQWIEEHTGEIATGGEESPADSFYALVKAVEDAGSTDKDKMVAALENGKERVFSGFPFSFTPTDHLARKPEDVIMITLEFNGKPAPTDPPYELGAEWTETLLREQPFNPTHLVRPTLEENRKRHPEVIKEILERRFGTQCTREPDGTLSPRCKIH
jgi:branched-chain amino acid transport system substrate-binding protein